MKHAPVAVLAIALLSVLAFAITSTLFWVLAAISVALAVTCVLLAMTLLNQRSRLHQLETLLDNPSVRPAVLPADTGGTRLPDLQGSVREAVPANPRTRSTSAREHVRADEPLSARAGEIIARNADRFPEAVLQRTHNILKRLEEVDTLIRVGRVQHENALLARAIALEYLPESLEGYLMLPPSQAMSLHLVHGKTGYDLLMEELSALGRASKDLLNQTAVDQGQALLVNHQFIREKFRTASRDFNV